MNAGYFPSQAEQKARHTLFKRIETMRELKDRKFPFLSGPDGDRSWNRYVEDSELILNGRTLSREAQGKEDWQSNMMDNIARAKMRAIASGVGLKVPEMKFRARNPKGLHSTTRAELFKTITKQTFLDGNPALHNFLEVWTMLGHGTLIEYEGYQSGGSKVRKVKSFDSVTGEVDVEDVYVKHECRPVSVIVNPQEFFWWDMYVRDIQDQPHLAWIRHYNLSDLTKEFGKFNNFKFVKNRKHVKDFPELQQTLMYDKWNQHVEMEDDYQVIFWYSKADDSYEIWCHGVPLFRGPLVWGDEEKYYPFAKSIAEPFANTNVFVGMSFGHIIEAYQDAKNTIVNSLIDKLYRSMEVPLLVGLENKDLLDWESEYVSQDNRYYVPNVDKVKPMPVTGINVAELQMLQIIEKGLESISIDKSQQGIQTGGRKTAKEVILADQRAQEMKSMLYLFMEDHWLQKTRLRTRNIVNHYLKDKAAADDRNGNIISVPNYQFTDGVRGTLDIHVARTKSTRLSERDIEARELAAQQSGMDYKIVSMPMDYMDSWKFDFEIVAESFHNQDKARMEEEFNSEVNWVATIYPEFLVANKDAYLREKLAMRGKSMEEFNPPAPPPMPMPGMPGAEGAPEGAAPAPMQSAPGTSLLGLS